MRNCLTILLNIVFKKDLEVLYGKGTMVEINDCKYCTSNFIICKIKRSIDGFYSLRKSLKIKTIY